MLKVWKELKKFLEREDVIIDGPVFRFHSVFTAVLLFACSVVITATQYVGSPIQCIVGSGLPNKPINTYCWITSTFSIPSAYYKRVGDEVAHPGVSSGADIENEKNKKYHSYYQWVCFVLFFQGLACYLPKYVWDNCERGLMKTLIMDMNRRYIYTDVEKKKKKQAIINYILQHLKSHRLYVIRYWFCELLCLINILVQMYSMNKFFDGEFMYYGLDVMQIAEEYQERRIDPMIYIFPRVTKCTFRKYGSSGTMELHDALCVLPLNVVNEKTYLLIWFWFVSLACILILLVIYRMCLIFFPSMRPRLLKVTRKVLLRRHAETVAANLDIGDWWLLYMLGKNLDSVIFNEIVVDLARKIDDPQTELRL